MARKIRCVTFDCYGTLIDWAGGIRRALSALPSLRDSGDRIDAIVSLREKIETGLIVSAPELPKDDSPDERYESPDYRPYREILAETLVLAGEGVGVAIPEQEARQAAETMPDWLPFPDTTATLRQIAERFPIAILSNVEEEVIARTVRSLGVTFDLIITAERVEAYKPSPDHWYAAMHELGADEDELLHLAASSFHDLETATLLGIPCGYINRAGVPASDLAGPIFEVRDLASAAERLKRFAPVKAKRTAPRAGNR